MQKMLDVSPDMAFIVFSDDEHRSYKFLRKLFLKKDQVNIQYVKGVTTPVELKARRKKVPQDQWDMFLISRCDFHIIANSSFSWWGGFLSENRNVLYPKNWWTPAVPEYDSMHLCFPTTWEGIEC
jgi:hypothetical protein